MMTIEDRTAAEIIPPAEPTPWSALPAGDYAIVELFGHTTLVGRIGEIERFGAKMLAMEPLFAGQLLPSVFHGGAAIYRLTPCSAEAAWKSQPKHEWQLPPTIRAVVPPELLEAPAPAEPAPGADDEDDRPF